MDNAQFWWTVRISIFILVHWPLYYLFFFILNRERAVSNREILESLKWKMIWELKNKWFNKHILPFPRQKIRIFLLLFLLSLFLPFFKSSTQSSRYTSLYVFSQKKTHNYTAWTHSSELAHRYASWWSSSKCCQCN